MYRVYKYTLQVTDEQVIKIPSDYEILCVQVQFGIPCIWAKVEEKSKTYSNVRIHTRGTGHEFNGKEGKYIGTYQLQGGELVFHVFEESENLF